MRKQQQDHKRGFWAQLRGEEVGKRLVGGMGGLRTRERGYGDSLERFVSGDRRVKPQGQGTEVRNEEQILWRAVGRGWVCRLGGREPVQASDAAQAV